MTPPAHKHNNLKLFKYSYQTNPLTE
jgi:hypothetical protein